MRIIIIPRRREDDRRYRRALCEKSAVDQQPPLGITAGLILELDHHPRLDRQRRPGSNRYVTDDLIRPPQALHIFPCLVDADASTSYGNERRSSPVERVSAVVWIPRRSLSECVATPIVESVVVYLRVSRVYVDAVRVVLERVLLNYRIQLENFTLVVVDSVRRVLEGVKLQIQSDTLPR